MLLEKSESFRRLGLKFTNLTSQVIKTTDHKNLTLVPGPGSFKLDQASPSNPQGADPPFLYT
jgi:hypothetical protein